MEHIFVGAILIFLPGYNVDPPAPIYLSSAEACDAAKAAYEKGIKLTAICVEDFYLADPSAVLEP